MAVTGITLPPVISTLIIILGFSLQVQITLFSGEGYDGIRLNLTDLLLPFCGVAIAISLLMQRSFWPAWKPRFFIGWIIALCLVMGIALIQGYITNGTISNWALINKFCGFFILICYLALGGWIASNVKNTDHTLWLFARGFVLFGLILLLVSLIVTITVQITPLNLSIPLTKWEGLMANRNSFVLCVLFSLILLESYRHTTTPLLPPWTVQLFWFLLPAFAFFNGSRSGWILGGVIILMIFLRAPKNSLKFILPWLAIGIAFITGLQQFTPVNNPDFGYQYQRLIQGTTQDVMYRGDQKRLIALEDGIELYQQSNPILGGGLGSFRPFQEQKRSKFIDIIDCTPLWLLTEMGILGFFTFLAFFTLCLKNLYETRHSPFHRALFYFLLVFAGMSLLHEIMYSRFVWFALGLALITATQNKNNHLKSGC